MNGDAKQRAAELWAAAKVAAGAMAGFKDLDLMPSIHLGIVPADVLREFVALSGAGTIVRATPYDPRGVGSTELFIDGMEARVAGVAVYAQAPSRPATAAERGTREAHAAGGEA